jgi:hypothetical protein
VLFAGRIIYARSSEALLLFSAYTTKASLLELINSRSKRRSVTPPEDIVAKSFVTDQDEAFEQLAMQTYPSKVPSLSCVTMTILEETEDWIGTANLTEEPAEGSSISEPQLPEPLASQKRIFGYVLPFPVSERYDSIASVANEVVTRQRTKIVATRKMVRRDMGREIYIEIFLYVLLIYSRCEFMIKLLCRRNINSAGFLISCFLLLFF